MDAEKRRFNWPVLIFFSIIVLGIVQVGLLRHQSVTFLRNGIPIAEEPVTFLRFVGPGFVEEPLDENGRISLGFNDPKGDVLFFLFGKLNPEIENTVSRVPFKKWGNYEINIISDYEREVKRSYSILGFDVVVEQYREISRTDQRL